MCRYERIFPVFHDFFSFRMDCWFVHTSANATSSSSSVGPVLASASPDFLGKLTALGFRRLVDDLAALIVLATAMVKGRLDVLREILCAGIVLESALSLACLRHCDTKTCVTPLAEPSQVFA